MTAVALSNTAASEIVSTVFYKAPVASKGPVILVIDSNGAALHTGKQQLFAASAVLSQDGEVLAEFSAYDKTAVSDLDTRQPYNDHDITDVAGLDSETEVFHAYKSFLRTCNRQVRDAFEDICTDDDAIENGLFQVIEVGYSVTHTHSQIMALRAHPLSSVMVGMGYKPNAIQDLLGKPSVDEKYRYNGTTKNGARVTDIYWKARNRDATLDSCKLF
jgi:hypothetical protein